MAEGYKSYKDKSSRDRKEETVKHKNKQRHYKESNRYETDSKTPPLPTKRTSIVDLIKQRETLKQELKKIAKHSDTDLQTRHKSNRIKNHKHSKHDADSQSRKRHSSTNLELNMKPKKQAFSEPDAETYGDHALAESEDEESIIEKRREQRKLLIEKLAIPRKERFEGYKQDDIGETSDEFKNDKDHNINSKTKALLKYVPDMFSEKDDFVPKHKADQITQDNAEENSSQLTDNWDDAEGYYNVKVGDEINKNNYNIKSLLGQGVFANVVRAIDKNNNTAVAIKIIRNNDLMFKTGLKEIAILKRISEADPDNKYHCIKYIKHFIHKGHLCIVLESLYLDLRCILKKYGKHGLNMKALISYSRQMLIALRLLKKIGVVHADIKPDNMLVNEKKNILKLCDFGSAAKADDHEPTPYLVSRFYRAPEIILGIPYKHSIDIWSAACTIFEMATGKIMFAGSSNNKMLKSFMDVKGRFPTKFIRKGKFKDQHFNYNNNFILHKKDDFSGREKFIEVCNIVPTRNIQKELITFSKCTSENENKKLGQLKDLLDKMLVLDIHQRYSVSDCLKHPFIQDELHK